MLILARCQEETVIMDRQIRVTVRAIGDGRVVIGIEAPKEVKIAREELVPNARRYP